MNDVAAVSGNLEAVRERIGLAARRSGRKSEEVRLVVVTKGRSVELVREAIRAGATEIGENRAVELVSKYEALGGRATWHFVGHLQRNKVKLVVPIASLIHSVDGTALAREIDKRAAAIGKVQDVLVEVNVSGEEAKYGLRPQAVPGAIQEMARLPNIRVRGLMTMAPVVVDPEAARPVFAELKALFEELSRELRQVRLDILSMGMTADFELAVEEGSTMVRIGTAAFEGREA